MAEDNVDRITKKLKNETNNDVIDDAADGEQTPSFSININDLPGEILRHILSCLNIKERIGIERVCKGWKLICTNSWKDFRVLNSEMLRAFKPTTKLILVKILKRCNLSLRELDLDFFFSGLLKFPIEICEYCPNLETIIFRDLHYIKTETVVKMIKSWKNIKNISLPLRAIESECPSEDCISWMLTTYDVEYLDLTNSKSVTGKNFYLLKECLHTLILNGCNNLTPDDLEKIMNLRQIRNLQLGWCELLTPECLVKVVESLQDSLVELHLAGHSLNCNKETFLDIAHFCANIQILNFSYNDFIDDDIVYAIYNVCPELRVLNLSATNVTNSSLACLAKLPRLQCLCLNVNKSISTTGLKSISNSRSLEQIELQGCFYVTTKGVLKLLGNCCTLKVLNIKRCINVLDLLLDPVFQMPRDRCHKLLIIAGGSRITRFLTENSVTVMY